MANLNVSQTLSTKLLMLDYAARAPDVLATFGLARADGSIVHTFSLLLKADGSGLFDLAGNLLLAVGAAVTTRWCVTIPSDADAGAQAAITAGKIAL